MTDLPDVSPGATWRCVDLHLHTPGVRSFRPGTDVGTPEQRAGLADRYVERLRAAGIDVAVMTDYQGVRGEWFDLIREKVDGVVVLPGAEMSIGGGAGKGIHLLLICNPGTDPERINRSIQHQHRDSQAIFSGLDHQDIDLRGTLEDALRAVRQDLGCVIVAAHARDSNGVIKALGAKDTAELIRDGLLDGLDKCENARETLRSTRVLTQHQLDALTCTQSSDPRNLDQIGTGTLTDGSPRLTWIKLSTVDATALRLALHDPQTRVLPRPPKPPAHPRLLSMEVQGGFLNGVAIRFNDDLTTLIGGKGSGKSAILETLRYALDGNVFSGQTERRSLVRAALGSGGRVRVVVERPGPVENQRYEVTRVLDQQSRVTELSSGTALEVPPMELFGSGGSPVILLQREIQAVARDDAYRRGLLDEIIGDEARRVDAIVRRTVEAVRRNEREIDEVERQLDRRDEHIESLHRLDAELAYFEQQGLSDKLARQGAASVDRAHVDTASGRVEQARAAHTGHADEIVDALEAAAADLASTTSEHAAVLQDLASEVSAVRSRVGNALETARRELDQLRGRLARDIEAWASQVASLDDELRRIQAELGQSRLDAGRYIEATRQRAALRPVVDGLERQEGARERLQADRSRLLRQLQDERWQASALRSRAAIDVNHVLDGALTMRVTYLGESGAFVDDLTAALRGSRASSEAVEAVAQTPGTDGVELVRLVDGGEEAVAEHYDISRAMAARVVTWLADPDRRRAVETLAPGDRVEIGLRVGAETRDLANLSDGQKATALLLLVFAQSGRPLVLDQPEDDLDNRFVYDDVVALLRREKGTLDPDRRRQIIAATHNANIPVNGDAELVLSLADVDGRCTVRTRASIDDRDVREEIRSVLEGGADAFRRRAEKYGGLDDPR